MFIHVAQTTFNIHAILHLIGLIKPVRTRNVTMSCILSLIISLAHCHLSYHLHTVTYHITCTLNVVFYFTEVRVCIDVHYYMLIYYHHYQPLGPLYILFTKYYNIVILC